MSMKKMLAVVAAASLVAVAAPAFAANPFSDVPMNHWAYDAVEELASKGVLEGYPNGTFKGNRAMTRYEIATMVARMMNAGLTGADLEKLKALVVEFQPELEALGVKVDGFDSRLSALEKGLGGWRITGQLRMDTRMWDTEESTSGSKANGNTMSRGRLFLHRDLSDKVSFDGRYHSGEFDRWWVTARDFLGMDGLTFKAGQFALDWEDDEGTYIDNDAFFMDAGYRGYDLKYSKGMFTVEGFAASNHGSTASASKGGVYAANASDELYGARMVFNFNEKLWLGLHGMWIDEGDNNYDVYWGSLGFKFTPGVELKGAYYIEDIDEYNGAIGDSLVDDSPSAWKIILDVKQDVLKFTSLWAEYAQIDGGFILDNNPWAFDDVVFPNEYTDYQAAVDDDVKVLFFRLAQKWNAKWTTIERYVNYDAEDDATEWSVAVRYQYTPNLMFELAYADYDGRFNSGKVDSDWDNNEIRFRTFLTF